MQTFYNWRYRSRSEHKPTQFRILNFLCLKVKKRSWASSESTDGDLCRLTERVWTRFKSESQYRSLTPTERLKRLLRNKKRFTCKLWFSLHLLVNPFGLFAIIFFVSASKYATYSNCASHFFNYLFHLASTDDTHIRIHLRHLSSSRIYRSSSSLHLIFLIFFRNFHLLPVSASRTVIEISLFSNEKRKKKKMENHLENSFSRFACTTNRRPLRWKSYQK